MFGLPVPRREGGTKPPPGFRAAPVVGFSRPVFATPFRACRNSCRAGVLAGRTGHDTTKKRPARTQAATICRTEIPISALLLWGCRSRPPGEAIPRAARTRKNSRSSGQRSFFCPLSPWNIGVHASQIPGAGAEPRFNPRIPRKNPFHESFPSRRASSPSARSSIRSSTSSMPGDRRTSVSDRPSTRRSSAGIDACVMLAG